MDLRLFHHTAPDALQLIKNSSVLRGSVWNYQGTATLENVCYAYLTSLEAIQTSADLQEIAMSSDGVIAMLLDDHEPPAGVVSVTVYSQVDSKPHRDAAALDSQRCALAATRLDAFAEAVLGV